MNPNQPGVSFGSGSQLLGANASQLLGMPGGLQQQSPSSAGYTPGTLPPTMPQQGQMPPQAPTMSPIQGSTPPPNQMPMPQAPQQGTVGTPPGIPETEMILKALISRLGVHSKHEEAVRNAVLPPQQGAVA